MRKLAPSLLQDWVAALGSDADAAQAEATAASLHAAGATAIVLCGGGVEAAAAVLRATPRHVKLLLLAAPAPSVDAHRLCGYAKAAHNELKRQVHCLFVAGELMQQASSGRLRAAGVAALHLLFATPLEIDAVVAPCGGLFAPRYVAAPPGQLPEPPPTPLPSLMLAAPSPLALYEAG